MTSTDAGYLAIELWKLLRTGDHFSDLRRRYDTFRSLRDGGGASSTQYARRHRRVMRLGGTLNRARIVLGERIRRCRQKVNGLATGLYAAEPWRTEVRRRLTPALCDLTDAIHRTLEIHPESGAGPTHTEILGALDRHETDIRECGQFLSDVAAEVQSVTPIDEQSRELRAEQSAESHAGDDLLRYLDDRPEQRVAVIELPERFHDPNVLTVSDADGLIEFGTRKHCWVGPVGKSELHVEKGWNFSSVIGPHRIPMKQFIAEALSFTGDERIRQHVHLTAKGRVRAARLKLSQAARETELKPPVTEKREATALDDLVTLDQAAAVVGRSKRSLELYLQRGDLPRPDLPGGGGKASRWYWSTLRPALEEHFRPDLPAKFPGSRVI